MKQRHWNFTLIELLIVVSIIAILAAMLLPSLSKARATAVGAKCISHLKQAGIAQNCYASDFGGWIYPPYHDFEKKTYFTVLAGNNYVPQGKAYSANSDEHISAILKCPDPWLTHKFVNGSYGVRFNNQASAYLNIQAKSPVKASYSAPFLAGSTLWKSAGEMILMGDNLQIGYKNNPCETTKSGHYSLGDNNYAGGGNGLPHFRHLGKCTILYGDGHVKAIRPAELEDSVTARNQWTYFIGYAQITGRYP